MVSPTSLPCEHSGVLLLKMAVGTMAGGADAQVGEVGGQAARAVGRTEGGKGHGVLGVQRCGQRWGELDVGQVGQGAASVVCGWKHGWVQFLVWWWEYAETKKDEALVRTVNPISPFSQIFCCPIYYTVPAVGFRDRHCPTLLNVSNVMQHLKKEDDCSGRGILDDNGYIGTLMYHCRIRH